MERKKGDKKSGWMKKEERLCHLLPPLALPLQKRSTNQNPFFCCKIADINGV